MTYYAFLSLIALGFVTWRITSFLVYEHGPLDVFARLRDLLHVGYDETSKCTGPGLAKALCCFKCTSVWVAWPIAALFVYDPSPLYYVANILGLSTVAIIVNAFVNGRGV